MSEDLMLRICYFCVAPGAGAGDESWQIDTRDEEARNVPPHGANFVCTVKEYTERALEEVQRLERGKGANLREVLLLADRRTGWGFPVQDKSPDAAPLLIVEGLELEGEVSRGKVFWPEHIPF